MSEETFRFIVAGGVILAAVSALIAAAVIVVIAVGLKKLEVRVHGIVDRAEPILVTSRRVLEDSAPKLSAVTTDITDVVKLVRDQSERLGVLIKDFSDRAKVQVARIDGAIDHTLEDVQAASSAAKGAVLRPVREVNGIFSGIKTAVVVYALGRRSSVDNATQDEEMFI